MRLALHQFPLAHRVDPRRWLGLYQQHGLGGHDAMVGCLTAAKAEGLPALVRVADNDPGLIGRALDAGAQGVVCPLINSAEDAERFVRAVKYPPRGTRSWGPYRAQFNIPRQYVPKANGWTIACPQIETKGALAELDDILSIEGVDMLCFGPNDLSAALTGRFDIHAKEVMEAMTLVLRKCREKKMMSFFSPTISPMPRRSSKPVGTWWRSKPTWVGSPPPPPKRSRA